MFQKTIADCLHVTELYYYEAFENLAGH